MSMSVDGMVAKLGAFMVGGKREMFGSERVEARDAWAFLKACDGG